MMPKAMARSVSFIRKALSSEPDASGGACFQIARKVMRRWPNGRRGCDQQSDDADERCHDRAALQVLGDLFDGAAQVGAERDFDGAQQLMFEIGSPAATVATASPTPP